MNNLWEIHRAEIKGSLLIRGGRVIDPIDKSPQSTRTLNFPRSTNTTPPVRAR